MRPQPVTIRTFDAGEDRWAIVPRAGGHRDRFGMRGIRTALLLPSWHEPGSRKLPVLLDPYGGPHLQRVLAAQAAFFTSQWLADQGFAVVVADGETYRVGIEVTEGDDGYLWEAEPLY